MGVVVKQNVLHILDENYDFSDNSGCLTFSTDFIELAFDIDEVREGSFRIVNKSSTPMKGFVLSNHMRMKCKEFVFEGDEAQIVYSFDSTGMSAGDVVKGDFQIVSNKGEYMLSFEATMEQGYLYSSLGHIRNLFHFANLAKTNWDEACSLYYSERFIELLTGSDAVYRTLYRGLSKDAGNCQCMDEFLVAVKKKKRIQYSFAERFFKFGEIRENKQAEIILHKDGWGYVKGTLTTECPFIHLEKVAFTEDDFMGSDCRLMFEINVEELHYGRNFGFIILDTGMEEYRIEVQADYCRKPYEKNEEYQWKRQLAQLFRYYVDFRLGHMERMEWVRKSEPLAAQINADADRVMFARLYQVQLLIAAEKMQDAHWMIERIEADIAKEKQYPEVYGYYLYLTTLIHKDEEYIDKVSAKIRKLYNHERANPILAWVSLYLREDLFLHPEKKWEFLQECYHQGINSPLLYVEALQLLADHPALLAKTEQYELNILMFARKHNVITPAIADRMQFLGGRKKNFENTWYNILVACYEVSPDKELLQTICSYLMKGGCTGTGYFTWYEKAVYAELKLTRLYEYFIQSIDLNDMRELPLIVMMYFAYQNNLDYERMAYLHVNVMLHKEKYPEIAASYAERLPDFVRSQVALGHISEHLAILYREVIPQLEMDVKLANDYARLLFTHEIIVEEQYIAVSVVHENFLGEEYASVINKKAFVPIYARRYHLICIDKYNNRYVMEQAQIKNLLFDEKLYQMMLPMVHDRATFLLHHCEAGKHYVSVLQNNVHGYAQLLESDETTFTYKKEILVELVKYYFDNDYIRELDLLLSDVRPEILVGTERGELIHILIARGMYQTAFEWICTYGAEHVEKKDILRLASRLLERDGFEDDEQMLQICSYLYRCNRYDQNVLMYLVLHFNGGIRETRNLLKACESFGVEYYVLMERLLVQTLFTGIYINEKFQLYENYMRAGGNSDIEKAFLARCSYDYFVKEAITDEKIFARIKVLLEENESLNRITRLAFLKYSSLEPEENWNVSLIEKLVLQELKNDCGFSFFSTFAKKISAILPFTDRVYVEYRGENSSRVIMHYAIEHDNGIDTEYRKEEMKNVYGGIFVKAFLLFFGESIQYYITEENGNREQLTQSSVVERTEELSYSADWKYSILDEAAIGIEMQDYQTCEKVLYEYIKKEDMVRRIFKVSNESE